MSYMPATTVTAISNCLAVTSFQVKWPYQCSDVLPHCKNSRTFELRGKFSAVANSGIWPCTAQKSLLQMSRQKHMQLHRNMHYWGCFSQTQFYKPFCCATFSTLKAAKAGPARFCQYHGRKVQQNLQALYDLERLVMVWVTYLCMILSTSAAPCRLWSPVNSDIAVSVIGGDSLQSFP